VATKPKEDETVKLRVFSALALVGLVGTLAVTMSASGGVHTQKASIKIGVSLAGYSTDFWSSYVAFEKAAGTKYGVSLVGPISSNGDAGKQATQIRTLIDEGVNALIVNPVDSAAIAPTLDYAASKHVPVVSVDVAPTKGKVYMIVRADNLLYGQAACNYIGSHAKGSGHVAMLEGDLASINGLDRKNGFFDCMKKYPNLKVVEYATKWDTPTAVNDAKTAISTYSDLMGSTRTGAPRTRHHRGREGGREVHEGRLVEPHHPVQQRRNAAGARVDPRRGGGRDDLAAREPLRAVRRLLRQAGACRRQVQGRHEDRPRQQDRQPARQSRGRDRRARRDEGERQRSRALG
jgi:substrate-binding family protein